jgi:hypothetical protein
MHEVNIDRTSSSNKEYIMENGYFLSEQIDEFDCTLREIVGDCIGEYLWMKLHPEEKKDFCEVFKSILKSYAKYEVFLVNEGEDGFFDEENKEKLEDF